MRLHNLSWRRGADTPSLHKWPRWSFARRAIPVIISRGTSVWAGQPRHCQPPALPGPRPSQEGAVSNWGSPRAHPPPVPDPQRCHCLPSPQAGQTLTECPLTRQVTDKIKSLQMCTLPKFSSLRTMWSSLTVIYSSLALVCWLHMVLISQPFSDDAMRLNDMAIVTKGWQH